MNLLNDKPIILNEENDLFGTLHKVKLLKEFFENQKDFLTEEKMVALYGGWGTGKSSVMKTLMSVESNYKLDKKRFKTIFFEAWKYENLKTCFYRHFNNPDLFSSF